MDRVVPTVPLPGIYFFDAWRVSPQLEVKELHVDGLAEVELTQDEARPEVTAVPETTQIDRLLHRQEILMARENAKTSADCAMEIGHVVQLTQALSESAEEIGAANAVIIS